MPNFTKQEYLDRVQRVQRRMETDGLDVLITCNPANMNYLTGYDGWSFYTPQLVALGLNDAEPICIVRGIDRPGGLVTTYLQEENMIGYCLNSLNKHQCVKPRLHNFRIVDGKMVNEV